MELRRNSRKIFLGAVPVGGGSPVTIQSMCNTPTRDARATLKQINSLAAVGCDLVRLATDTQEDLAALPQIIGESPLPVIADIQFESGAAVNAIHCGVAGIRINPGLVHDETKLRPIAMAALEYNVPIRVGVNGGSLPPHCINFNGVDRETAVVNGLVEAALKQCESLEKLGVKNIKVALKSSSVAVTLRSYREFARRTDYPLHLGLTEAGTPNSGEIKSAVVLGALLTSGIGDTIRVSLTAPPEREVEAAKKILSACGLRKNSVELVSCPTCGRTEIDLPGLADKVEKLLTDLELKNVALQVKKVAVMGCPVNGPGEARDADLGIAGSRNKKVIIFRSGQVIGAFDETAGFARFKELLTNFKE